MVIRTKVKKLVSKEDAPAREKEFTEVTALHCDIIRDRFWNEHPELLK